MHRTGWTDTLFIIASGSIVLVISILLIGLGFEPQVYLTLLIITPIIALILGLISLRTYAGRSEARNDRLNILNLWLSVGLIMFCLAEITSTLARVTESTQQMILTMLFIQIPGILLWGLGITQYLKSLNNAIRIVDNEKLWMALVIVACIFSIGLMLIVTLYLPPVYLLERVILAPLIIGLVLFSSITLGLVWVFRDGLLSRPMIFILLSFSLLTIRGIFWMVTNFQIDTPIDSLIAIEVYILCGAALILSRDLEKLNL